MKDRANAHGRRRRSVPILLVAAALLWVSTGPVQASFTAAPGSPVAVGPEPLWVAVGDFDGIDGPDLAVVNYGSSDVTVLLNDGSGGFTEASGSPVGVGFHPYSVAVGDFDGADGPDLAVASASSGDVTVLLNDGLSVFTEAPGSPYDAGSLPVSVAVGDFDGINGPDLAVANNAGNSVTVLLNDGSGGFTEGTGSPFGVLPALSPFTVAVGDFDGIDGPDLAVAGPASHDVTVLLNDGLGVFTPAPGSPFGVGLLPYSVAVGDFDGIGGLDLAVANGGDSTVTVLLNDGSGGFTEASGSPFAVGSIFGWVAVGDFDGVDGPDLAVATAGSDNVTVLLNDGSGGFTEAPGSPFAAGVFPRSVAVGDFDGIDGPDLAVANTDAGEVTILLNDGFAAGPAVPADPCDSAPPMGYNLVDGDDGPNTLTGTAGNDFVRGFGGNDLIDGNGGSDILCGGEGDDRIWSKRNKGNGDKGPDTISGGGGHDRIVGGPAGNLIFGGPGDDVVDVLGTGEDDIYGGVGNDILMAGAGNDSLDGGDGDDDLGGGAGNDTLAGGPGDDDFYAGAGTDACIAGGGTPDIDFGGECESGP